MQDKHNIELIKSHTPIWEALTPLINKNKLPQALLFIGPRHAGVMQFVARFIALLNCTNDERPCSSCQSCQMLLHATHPDLTYLSSIKVDQIRLLQEDVYQPPQCAPKKFIIIESADTMNTASVNALLKILEEPPKHTIFILLAEQICDLKPTILSRCQKYIFTDSNYLAGNYLNLGKLYPETSPRAQLCAQQEKFSQELNNLMLNKITPCELAKIWSAHDFEDLLWFLYLLTAQMIKQQGSIKLFDQLKKIDQYTSYIRQGVSLNHVLALESLLIGYIDLILA